MKKGLLLISLLFTLSLVGCSFQGKQVYFTAGDGAGTVFRIDNSRCNEKEVRVYLANAYNLYGKTSVGDIWDLPLSKEGMLSNIKDMTLEHLTMVYSMNLYASELEMDLSDEEKEQATNCAAEYMSTLSDKDKEYLDVSEKDIAAMYERYILAVKVYDHIITSVDDEVSEDEARIMDGYLIYVTDSSKVSKIEKAFANGEAAEDIARKYSEKDKEQVSFGRGQYPDAFDSIAFELDDGEYGGPVEADGGYYFIYCIDKYNKDLSEENKHTIIETRKENTISDIMNEQYAKSYSGLNKEKWESISPEPDKGVTTDQFFSIVSR